MSASNTTTVDLRPGFSWSYSKLKNFETCPKRHYHYDVVRDVREPESEELRFGNELHSAYAMYLQHQKELPLVFAGAKPMLDKLRDAPGLQYVENKWAISSSFGRVRWGASEAWYRGIVDFGKWDEARSVITIIDWKTGKVKDDETQLQLLAALAFINFGSVKRVKAALVFTQHAQTLKLEFTRDQQREIWTDVLPRVKALRTANETQEFPPKPGGLCKRHCAVVSCPHHGR